MSRIRLFLEWLGIMACSLALAWWAVTGGATSRADLQLLDIASGWRAGPAADDILLVTIDDASLSAHGQWPWDRAQVARLVDRLDAGGARAIVLDILFLEPTSPQSDHALAQAMERSGKVAIPHGFAAAQDRSEGFDPQRPLDGLAGAALASGQVVLEPDADGMVRRVPIFVDEGTRRFPHLQLAIYRKLEGHDPEVVRLGAAAARVPPVLPLRPAGFYRSISAGAVLAGEVPADFLRGRLVMVGASAQGLGDIHATAAHGGSAMPGVEVQANLQQALRENAFIEPMGPRDVLWFAILPIFLLFVGFWRLRPALCLVLALLLVAASLAASIALVAGAGIWWPPGPVVLAIVAAYPLWGWRRLSAVSDYLDQEAGKLVRAGGTDGRDAATFGGFDNVAKQVSLLGYLVDEVAERRAFLTMVIETAPDAICVFDADGRLLLMNGRARAIFGEEPEGITLEDLVLSVRGTMESEGRELVLPGGATFAMATSQASREAAELGAPGWRSFRIVAFVDITDIRRAEEERRQMLEFLSHDMRSPQVAILGLAEERKGQGPAAERFGRIIRHARRTLKLADGFVQLSRLAEAPLVREDVDIGALVEESIDRAWFAAREKQVALVQSLPDEAPFIRGDGEMLSRAIDNLLGNAIKYGPEGSKVTLIVARAAGTVRLTIADEGPGLPEGRREDPFRRFGPRDGSGAGLGLAFVRAAVEKHGGTIVCLSGAHGGTIFTLSFPDGDA